MEKERDIKNIIVEGTNDKLTKEDTILKYIEPVKYSIYRWYYFE